MNYEIDRNLRLTISNANEQLVIPVGGFTRASIQFRKLSGNAWTAAVVTLRVSLDGVNAWDLASVTTVEVEGIVYDLDVSRYAYLHLVVTTAEGTTSEIDVTVYKTDLVWA